MALNQNIILELPLWPRYLMSSYRYFKHGEKHISRVFEDYVLLFVFDNELYFTENGEDVTVPSGTWYIQLPHMKQDDTKGSPAPAYYYIHFSAPSHQLTHFDSALFISDTMIHQDFLNKVLLPLKGAFNYKQLKPYFDRLEFLSNRQPWDIASSQAVFLSILSTLTEQLQLNELSRDDLIPQVMDYLALHYKETISASDLQENFHLSPDYIARKMKQYCGITPWQYIQLLRINQAKGLLLNTDYSLFHIASEIGYSDQSVFYKAFRKHTGLAPGTWRKKNRGLF